MEIDTEDLTDKVMTLLENREGEPGLWEVGVVELYCDLVLGDSMDIDALVINNIGEVLGLPQGWFKEKENNDGR